MHNIHQPDVIFGLDPLWFAGALFVFTYAMILTERLNRAIVSLTMACLMILGGVLTQEAAFQGVDFNTLGLLTGMMIIVGITKDSGVFQYLAIWSAKRVNADPWGILITLVLVTAILSALLDNVTTVLLIAPVTLLITDALKVSAYPYLFAEIFASNIGGTATLIGDPPNIMIGSAVGLSFNDFLFNLAPLSLIVLPLTLIPIYLIWGRKLVADPQSRQQVMNYREADAITDPRLLKQSMFVLALVMAGFILAHDIGQQPATIAMFGAAVLLILISLPLSSSEQSKRVHKAFCEVEWTTIFFFIGLFIVVYGVETTGLLEMLAHQVLDLTGGDKSTTAIAILWVSAVASAVVDNIPFVATMIPLIENMAVTFGGSDELMPLWWSLALGSCLGGNGSLVGASANLIVAGFAERAGQPIRFLPFMLMAFPLMLMSILVSSFYVYLRYF
ncbi:MAG: membrane protein [Gammaproteobacteria bacterium (ex Lamellibrachia satsuma)]|nr:MAG: ArsB/NhaD family transporter [Gammaproteobacteria bacterium (ex Lamellibrachia satsuma)]RRS31295.1 MAG: membrane protein [Gammaproteobacteria bacterium (ex Lamellibrachia satsuma)]RRS36963.1 MAG: membrane protein [Gammaproteobacteria bacterium (ex Lamellibrachia satsuma)]